MKFLKDAKGFVEKLKKTSPDEEVREDSGEELSETTGVSEETLSLMEFNEAANAETPADILKTLGIPETYEISQDYFFPEDLDNVEFHVQAPRGYDMGQVSAFVAQTQATVAKYVELLRKRNKDVAELATVIDRLKVSLNNLRFQTEMDAGISVMSSDSDELEAELAEEQLKSRRLEEELERLRAGGGEADNSELVQRAESAENEVSVLRREIASLQGENEDLRKEIHTLERNASASQETTELPQVDDNELELPDFDMESLQGDLTNTDNADNVAESAFTEQEESLDDFVKKNLADFDEAGNEGDDSGLLYFLDEE